jgi:ABC-2 type transport system ATP-binding protein
MAENVLEVKNLHKNYGSFEALKGVSFVVPKGKIIGLLGPNGAGKTTTIHILLGVTLGSGGEIKYFGKDFFAHRQECLQRINFSSAYNTLQGRITVKENLQVFALLYQVPEAKKKIEELAEYFEIGDMLDDRFWYLSAGQKTRVNIVKSLLNDPELILLDEPTASLDPDIADKTLTLIEKLNKEKQTSFLYTSHDMAEVTRICHEVIFLDQGRVVAQDTPLGLTKRVEGATLRIAFDGSAVKLKQYLTQEGLEYNFVSDFCVAISTQEKMVPKLIFALSNIGLEITDIEIKKPTLEDVFLQIARKEPHAVE